MLDPPGPDLDLKVARCIHGEAPRRIPAFSTDGRVADRAIRSVAAGRFSVAIEESGGLWYCECRPLSPSSRASAATGSGETRALAISRAILEMGPAIREPRRVRSKPSRAGARIRRALPGRRGRGPSNGRTETARGAISGGAAARGSSEETRPPRRRRPRRARTPFGPLPFVREPPTFSA